MALRLVMPLRVLLPCLAVCLTAAAAVAIGLAGISTADGFATRQADDAVRACASSIRSHGPVTVPGYDLEAVPGPGLIAVSGSAPEPGLAGSGTCGAELVSASRRVLIPAARSGGRWRIVSEPVHYQVQRMLFVYGTDDLRYVISGRAGRGSSGMLIVAAELAGTGQVAVGSAAAAGTVLVLLAAAAFAVTRAILRPVRAAAGPSAHAGLGTIGRLDITLGRLDMVLAEIGERLQASRAAEAAARRSAADMAGHLAEICLQLRRPVSIVYGFAGYLRQQDDPRPASLERMLRRVTDEVTRMETLAAELRMPSAGGPTGQDHQRQ